MDLVAFRRQPPGTNLDGKTGQHSIGGLTGERFIYVLPAGLAPAFEIEEFVRSIIEQSEEVHESPADAQVEQFYSLWNRFDLRTQTKSLSVIIKEAVFDLDAGSIRVTLVNVANAHIRQVK